MPQTLEARVQLLEDLAAIQKLTATYGHAVDFGLEGSTPGVDTLAGLFTEDATWFYTATGVTWRGREEIVSNLGKANAGLDFAMHSFTNPVIDVDGDKATGRYLLWVAISGNEVFQRENLTYERTAQGWRIASIDLRFGQMLNA